MISKQDCIKNFKEILERQDPVQVNNFISECENSKLFGLDSDSETPQMVISEIENEREKQKNLNAGVGSKALSEFDKIAINSFYDNRNDQYMPMKSLEYNKHRKAYNMIMKLKEHLTVNKLKYIDLKELDNGITKLQLKFLNNMDLKTGGNPIKLTSHDIGKLKNLKGCFSNQFPFITSNYGAKKEEYNNILRQLGEVLLEKELPENVDKNLKKSSI